jgi:Protein of unknown function (DUF3363)
MDLVSAPSQRLISRLRLAATGRPGSTASWSRAAAHHLLTPGSADAMERRKPALVDMGHASRLPGGGIRAPVDLLSRLERAEVTRAGQAMAAERGLTFQEAKTGEYVSGRLIGSTQLASGRFAMIDNGLGFSLVPWQPVLDKRIDQQITGTIRDGGGIEWDFGRKRGLGL